MQNQNDNVLGSLQQLEEEEEEDVEQLEESVVEMSQQILDYRNTFSDELKTTLASLRDSQIPILPPTLLAVPSNLGRSSGSASEASLTEDDSEDIKKLEILKQKISSNASAIPATLRRMRECMDHMDKLQSCNGIIYPAFKKNRPTD